MVRRAILCFAAIFAFGCGDDGDGGDPAGTGAQPAGGSGGAGTGGSGGAGTGGAGVTGGAESGDLVPLPAGSREADHILNLVDADAVVALDEFLMQPTNLEVDESDDASLDYPARLFYEYYHDDYDFLVFLSEKHVSDKVLGIAESVSTPAIPGTGVDRSSGDGFGSAGRLATVIGMDFTDLATRPPFAHEVAHRWAVHLDESLGFGDEFLGGEKAHWGSTSVYGQLGGFDGSTLRCATPAGALPPNCTPESSGRFHYSLGLFSPLRSVSDDQPYAPLELYLMGLMAGTEIPQSYTLLNDAAPEPVGFDDATGSLIIDAAGTQEITLASIQAVHGERAPLAASERSFRMAVVVLTAAPASDAMIQAASLWAESFGGYAPSAPWPSFETLTGGRARMDTRLGARRSVGDAPDEPPPAPASECSVLSQDCAPGQACYDPEWSVCLPAGQGQLGDTCAVDEDCGAGLACSFGMSASMCAPYCDPGNAASPKACATLCPDAFVEVVHTTTFETVGAYCLGGSGEGLCDPLAQDCAAGSGCYGRESTTCQGAGTTPVGQTCYPMGAVCVPGAECIGFQGADAYCQPYCDPAGSGANACATRCPQGAWPYGAYSICIPNP